MVDAVLPNVLNNFSTTRELHMQSGNNEIMKELYFGG